MSIHDEGFIGTPSAPVDGADEPTVLVPVFEEAPSPSVVDAATALAEAGSASLLFVKVVTVSAQTPLELPAATVETHRNRLDALLAAVPGTTPPTRGVLRIGHTPSQVVATAAADHDATTVVVPGSAPRQGWAPRQLRTPFVDAVDARTDCDVVVGSETDDYETLTSMLVPVADVPRAKFAVRVAEAIAAHNDAWIEFCHVLPPTATDGRVAEAERRLEEAMALLDDDVHADTWLLEANEVPSAIVEQSAFYDVTVVAASCRGRLRRLVSGSTATEIERRADTAVLTVRENSERAGLGRWLDRVT